MLYYRGLLYALMDHGVLVCFDGKTGTEHYRQRLGGTCNSSPIASDGRIYLSNNNGTFLRKWSNASHHAVIATEFLHE